MLLIPHTTETKNKKTLHLTLLLDAMRNQGFLVLAAKTLKAQNVCHFLPPQKQRQLIVAAPIVAR